MPNLVGQYRFNEAVQDLLPKQMMAVSQSPRALETYKMQMGPLAVALLDHGILENGPQPAISENGRWQVMLDGEILNLAELTQEVDNRFVEIKNRTKSCADLIAHHGLRIVPRLSGAFCLIAIDHHKKETHLIADRLGIRPLFMWQDDQQLLFATELKGLMPAFGQNLPLDTVAIAEQLIYGVHFKGRTWVDGVSRLQPSSILTISGEGRITHKSYWTYQYNHEGTQRSVADYAEEFSAHLKTAVQRCTLGNQRIGLFLSGGYDSRSVAGHLPLNTGYPTFTFGEPDCRDMQIAPVLAKRLGLRHIPLPEAHPYLTPTIEPATYRIEGLLPFSNVTSVQFHERIAAEVDIILTGFLGEFSGSHTWPQLLIARNREAAMAAIKEKFFTSRLHVARSVIRADLWPKIEEEMAERLHSSFEAVVDDHPLDFADAWNYQNLQQAGAFQAPAVDRHVFEMRAPHCDVDLVDFLLTIPPYKRIEQRVYKRMIADAFPHIRDLPCANSMAPTEPRFLVEYPKMVLSRLGRVVRDGTQRLLGMEGDRLGRELNDLDSDFLSEVSTLDQYFARCLTNESALSEVFNLKEVQALRQSQSTARSGANVLCQLLTFGLAHQQLSEKA